MATCSPQEMDAYGLCPGEPGYAGPVGGTATAPRLRIPGNLVDVIEAVSNWTGVPFEIIAGTIQTKYTTGTSGDWPSKITPDVVADVALRLQRSVPAHGPNVGDWRIAARDAFGEGRSTWLDRFDSIVYPTVGGKPDLSRPTWIEREDTSFDTGPGATRSDLEQALKRGVIDLGTFRSRMRGLGYSDPDIDLFLATDMAAVGPRPVDIADVFSAFDALVGRKPTEAEAQRYVGMSGDALRGALLTLPEARQWREFGEDIQQTRRWMDQTWFEFYGRAPTNDEVIGVVKGGYTPESLERWVREQPIMGTTRGRYQDVRRLADAAAQDIIGRDADEGELNWLMENLTRRDASGQIVSAPTADSVAAFYTQLKQRVETGDPTFAWVVAPEQWRSAQAQLQQIWTRAGLIGEPDPRTVNEAFTRGWTIHDMEDHVNSLPAPGFAQGVTVGEVGRVRRIASTLKEGYLPGDPLTKEEMAYFVAWTPLQMRDYYRSLPVAMQREARDRAKQSATQTTAAATTVGTGKQRTAYDLLSEHPDWVQDPVTHAFRPPKSGESQPAALTESMNVERTRREKLKAEAVA